MDLNHTEEGGDAAAAAAPHGHGGAHGGRTWGAVIGALGVVYGDIGTSPLYTLRQAFGEQGPLSVAPDNVLGLLSVVFWSLILVVTVKYVTFILRADNRGEGGVLALSTLALTGPKRSRRHRRLVLLLAMAGLSLFYGDGLITPAISVLSAVEGLEVAAPQFEQYVVPITIAVLLGLFLVQSRGTARVGALFGPMMALWFVVLGALGAVSIVQTPEVLAALNPRYAASFALEEGWLMLLVLGVAVLSVTGAEALYADMGHFGRFPIRVAWLGLVFPGLVLNYFGQGALLLREPEAAVNPFYLLAPQWGLIALVGLSTIATIIASQAVISGVFSLTRQAVQLGYLPRMEVRHTSMSEIGQVYIPRLNWMLLIGVLILVGAFKSSENLAAAYGIAVTGAMAIDSVLAAFVARDVWRWSRLAGYGLFGALMVIDLSFFAATLLKIPQGGWFPLVVAAGVYALLSTWRRGRLVVYDRLYRDAPQLKDFLERADRTPIRVSGTAVFMTANLETIPQALLHNLKHNKVLHERIILMTVITEETPTVSQKRRVEVEKLGKGFHTVVARYGFMERPDVPRALEQARSRGLACDMMETSFFLGRETLVPSSRSDLNRWQESVFMTMAATALSATTYFCIPPNRVVEVGAQIDV